MKNIISLLEIIAVVAMIGFVFTACGGDDENTGGTHTHTYSTTWSRNATQHWKECTGAGCDAKTETANHAPSNGVCTTCQYDNTPPHTHTYSTTWSRNVTQHWKECTGAGCDAKTETANHAPANGVCTTCQYDNTPPHTHTYSTTWSRNATQHWKGCTSAGCDAKTETDSHAPANGVCTTCGYDNHIHTYSTTWSRNATQHWKWCTGAGCDAKTETANHVPSNGVCTTCGYDNTGGNNNILGNIEMVQIPAGTFTMGSPTTEPNRYTNEGPQRQVTLNGFYMGKYEVTQAQWTAVMGSLPSSLSSSTTYGRGDNYPIYYVSWYDAVVFCNKLSMNEGLTPAYRINNSTNPADWGTVPTSDNATWNAVTIVTGSTGYRLPTEAQWEYACRAGTTTAYNTGTGITTSQARFGDGGTITVGSYTANAWGLHDMHGNVWEWCWDWYGWSYYGESGNTNNPMGPASGTDRVGRGGSWDDSAEFTRSANRGISYPGNWYFDVGFRVVRP